jgi:magnesium chelatase subunit H
MTVTAAASTPIRICIVTLDTHLATATAKARETLQQELPGLTLTMHAASAWAGSDAVTAKVIADIERADIVVATMLFLEDHFLPLLPALQARRDHCDALVCAMSAGEVTKLTTMGGFDMSKPASGPLAFLKKLRGNTKDKAAGADQMKMLRRLPQILRFIPGVAQDVRAYFLALQYWLGGSEENMANMVRFLVSRYAKGERKQLRALVKPEAPFEYPELGVYHPKMKGRLSSEASSLPVIVERKQAKGRVGVLVLRSYLIAGNSGHYDPVIDALEKQGLDVVTAFASGLDSRPAIERFFMKDGKPSVDAVVSLSGFSLVGGPAYNDAKAAEEILATLDVPYVAAHPVEFQTLEQWGASDRGLLPVESTIMVAIPELDGSTVPMVYGGRPGPPGTTCKGCDRGCTFTASKAAEDMFTCAERTEMLASRVAKLVSMRKTALAHRKVAVVLFNFPPNAGNTGTAAYLAVFESLFNTLKAMKAEGYTVDVPESVDALRDAVLNGNRERFGTDTNVHAQIGVDDHVRRERWLETIEAQWGPAPGKQLANGRSIFVLGKQFGNVLVGVQPAFGYEGDPMRLLFEKGWAPTHAFSAFYRYLREDFGANAVLHFGTHGALEFMPGKQSGLSGACWPDRMIGDLPNLYLYASNNPSEGAIAKRRSGATLVSYLTPPVAQAGLYKGLSDLKASIQRFQALEPAHEGERDGLVELILAQGAEVDLVRAGTEWPKETWDREVTHLSHKLLELEETLIPHGLHVVGQALSDLERIDMLAAMADAHAEMKTSRTVIEALVETRDAKKALVATGTKKPTPEELAAVEKLAAADALLRQETELGGILRALDGRYIRPAPGGDVVRTPDVLPTGRNLHGFDPFRIPSAFAMADGAKQAQKLLERFVADGNPLPESIAIVLWGSDNLKSEGAQMAQAMALMGARARFDSYGRLAGSTLVPLEELGRPRVDVVMTLSGIFRDLMPLQIKLLAEAAFLAASAEDEPLAWNFVRKHALAYQAEHGCDLETASLRVFGNADGAYGANVNNLVENGKWGDEGELADTYTARKGFAYGRAGQPKPQQALLKSVLSDVALTYQNLESVELGVTTVDNYFDTLGGITKAVKKAKGSTTETPVYIGDQTRGEGTVRTLSEQVSLETHTRMLNPKWFEGMLKHGYEGVRQIEVHVTNTMGWSATTGQVQPWVYQKLSETFLLDPVMRDRLAELNPTASARMANRLLEASERQFWQPDEATKQALLDATEELEDRLERGGPVPTRGATAAASAA